MKGTIMSDTIPASVAVGFVAHKLAYTGFAISISALALAVVSRALYAKEVAAAASAVIN
jgi:hypothetical protein